MSVAHRITEEQVAWDAAAVLADWYEGYMTLSEDDPRQYKVVLVGSEDTRITVEVRSSSNLDVVEEQFEVEVRVRKVDV
jgi:hypothetical protein